MPAYIHSDKGSNLISAELRTFLHSQGIATSNTTPYHPQGNGQCERYNGVIWKTVQLALKSKGLSINCWEDVLTDALHSVRSLLCTSTNSTPHERMFHHPRRSTLGVSLPGWLCEPGPVLLRNFKRASKYEPLVSEVELVHANPNYALVRFPCGRESNVSLKDLAPAGDTTITQNDTEPPRPDTDINVVSNTDINVVSNTDIDMNVVPNTNCDSPAAAVSEDTRCSTHPLPAVPEVRQGFNHPLPGTPPPIPAVRRSSRSNAGKPKSRLITEI